MSKKNSYIVICKQCNKEFRTVPSFDKKFCSNGCYGKSRRGRPLTEEHKRKISDTNKKHPPITAFKNGQQASPSTQFKKGQFGNKAGHWKGGMAQDAKGYVMILQHGHPRASKKGYVKRSYLVIEQVTGIPIRKGQVVHHVNKIKTDDRFENLKLFNSHSEHRLHHIHNM